MNIRTSKPEAGNKFYNTKSNGGYSTCIKGNPTDKGCDVLANCVGYGCGRFNEIIGSMKYPSLNCNAENFIERAISLGLKTSVKPTLGGIMVWQKGKTLSGSDGAGHIAIVERIDNENQIYTSESAYKGSAFWNSIRTNTNGNWGSGAGYTYRGCIINPSIKEEPKKEEVKKTTYKYKIGDKVIINGTLYGTSDGTKAGNSVKDKVTTITRIADGKKKPYNTTGDLGWIAENQITKYVEKTFKVGDYVVPIKLVDYSGKRVFKFDKKYQIISIDKRGAVLGAVRGTQRPIWAVISLNNLKGV